MAASLEIRVAERADCETIAALLTQLNHGEGNEVARALFSPAREVMVSALVAVEDEAVIGVVLYYPGYDTLSASYGHHLADIIVSEGKRGRGIGKLLVKALAKLTLAAGKEWISLTVLQRNDAAHGFYKALGMTQVSVHFFAAGKQALSAM